MSKNFRKVIYNNIILIISIIILIYTTFILGYEYNTRIYDSKFAKFEDKNGDLSIQEVQSKEVDEQFEKLNKSYLNVGMSKSVWWIRFRISKDDLDKKILVINNFAIKKATLYYLKKDELIYTEINSGWKYKKNSPEKYAATVFRMPPEINRKAYIYISMQSPYSLTSSISYLTEKEFSFFRYKDYFMQGVLFGLIAIMLLYNITLFISFRSKTIIYYSFYLVALIIYHIEANGVFWITWHEFGRWNESSGFCLVYSYMLMLASIFFVKEFLEAKCNFPRFNRTCNISSALCFLGIGLIIFGLTYIANVFASILAIILLFYITGFALYALKKGYSYAKNIYYGCTITIIGNILMVFGFWGIITNRYVALFLPIISSWLTAMLFSVALAERIEAIQVEKKRIKKTIEETVTITKTKFIASRKAQIDTRILFDAMDAAADFCLTEPAKAKEVMVNMSDFLRHKFDFNNNDIAISFKEELKHIEVYMKLLKSINKEK